MCLHKYTSATVFDKGIFGRGNTTVTLFLLSLDMSLHFLFLAVAFTITARFCIPLL